MLQFVKVGLAVVVMIFGGFWVAAQFSPRPTPAVNPVANGSPDPRAEYMKCLDSWQADHNVKCVVWPKQG